MTIDLSTNEDWQVTREIYADSIVTNERATLHLPISLTNMVGIRHLREGDSNTFTFGGGNATESTFLTRRFQFLNLNELGDPPIVTVSFDYQSEESPPHALKVSLRRYPAQWPRCDKESWSLWINNRSEEVLRESGLSYSVCEFIEHEAMSYFEIVDTNESLGYSAVMFRSFQNDEKWLTSDAPILDLSLIGKRRTLRQGGKSTSLTGNEITLTKYARQIIESQWQHWLSFECPICFTNIKVTEGKELPCKHMFCVDCLSMFLQSILSDLQTTRHNPFICPIPECKQDMNLLANPIIKNLISDHHIEKISSWKKNVTHPPANYLKICPRKKCQSRAMLQLTTAKTNTSVFCDTCGATYCEQCLTKASAGAAALHDTTTPSSLCPRDVVRKLCRRYHHLATTALDKKCIMDERWHWLDEYAHARWSSAGDIAVQLWCSENKVQFCPTCAEAIERSEGCFHMQCSRCGTHFCYECGDEIFYPYYGTHHCWERAENDFDFND
mmetsp:Transcript_44375/g.53637  ORF Transcript_44375/g.53637 Transcript_44375/m.53637 type:complete len:499 (-) Transcript_44375:332-1828(-)|eukprot:CAMPEP_0172492466 /NCGR_PEP_ID=MMETSP1066-20121228/23636_1 /TAXON_ID=671091 /ORGANISM="Coscinodiscus wailesii, Strain CCMP2513" /LENGTH=498 /DNA_ID=CAMNT_0013262121 /DNA_START=60 /DNA_END=1556 /DNA_ORIENTATION=+